MTANNRKQFDLIALYRLAWLPIALGFMPGCATPPSSHSTANFGDPMLSPYFWPEWTPTSLALLDCRDNDPGIPPERLRSVAPFLTLTPEKKTAPDSPQSQPGGNVAPEAEVATEYSEVGKTVRLGVTADGSPPFRYQWLRNGEPLANGTDKTLTLENVSEADAGTYVCVVSNSAGEKASQTIRLVIRKPQ